MENKDRLEIVIPVYNEEECLNELMRRLLLLREKAKTVDISIIFVNDGSNDRSAEMLEQYAEKHPFIKLVHLSRNFGHQMAITAGLDHANADYVAIIDADLQDPPELIEDMYKKAKEGFDVVYGKRLARKGESLFKTITAAFFYKIISILCEVEIPPNTGDFRLISSKVLNILKNMREQHRFIRGMVPWIGFKSAPFEFNRDERFSGKTKYSLRKMVKFALNSIFSFSNFPLKLASYIGELIVGFGIFIGLFLLYLRLFTGYTVPGITSVILAIIIMGGIQIIMIGVMGEYIGRIFEESKRRPLYVVSMTKNIKEREKA